MPPTPYSYLVKYHFFQNLIKVGHESSLIATTTTIDFRECVNFSVLYVYELKCVIFQEKFGLQVELQASNEQIRQQLEYCSAMGAACCTLLWRVSRCEESIQAILVGVKHTF